MFFFIRFIFRLPYIKNVAAANSEEMAAAIPRDILKLAVPMQRAGTAAEVAETVKFLMSDGASYITRQVISVNGGLL